MFKSAPVTFNTTQQKPFVSPVCQHFTALTQHGLKVNSFWKQIFFFLCLNYYKHITSLIHLLLGNNPVIILYTGTAQIKYCKVTVRLLWLFRLLSQVHLSLIFFCFSSELTDNIRHPSESLVGVSVTFMMKGTFSMWFVQKKLHLCLAYIIILNVGKHIIKIMYSYL